MGDTTHGFITNRDKAPLKGHGHVPDDRTGRVMDLTQAEFKASDHISLRGKRNRKHSTLNSNPDDQPRTERVYVLPRILSTSEIVLCNEEVTGLNGEPAQAQTVGQREAALLDNRNPDDAANELFASRNNPNSAAIIIKLKELPAPTRAFSADVVTDSASRVVKAARTSARVIHEFLTSDDEAMKRRRRIAAGVVGGVALTGAAVVAYRKLPDTQKEALKQRALDGRAAAAQKAGALLLSAQGTVKEKAKNLRSNTKTAIEAVTETTLDLAEEAKTTVEAVIEEPATVLPTKKTYKERAALAAKAAAKQGLNKSKTAARARLDKTTERVNRKLSR